MFFALSNYLLFFITMLLNKHHSYFISTYIISILLQNEYFFSFHVFNMERSKSHAIKVTKRDRNRKVYLLVDEWNLKTWRERGISIDTQLPFHPTFPHRTFAGRVLRMLRVEIEIHRGFPRYSSSKRRISQLHAAYMCYIVSWSVLTLPIPVVPYPNMEILYIDARLQRGEVDWFARGWNSHEQPRYLQSLFTRNPDYVTVHSRMLIYLI